MLTLILSGVATSVVAETRENPSFETQSGQAASGAIEWAPASQRAVPRRLPAVSQSRDAANMERAIVVAARRSADGSSQQTSSAASMSTRYLQSITSDSCRSRAARNLDDAYREYSVGAWASAEASAWKALELTATGIDVDARQEARSGVTASAAEALRVARTAIREARDFVHFGAAVDHDLILGIATSHQTPVLAGGVPTGMTPTEAADRYLDYARVKLTPLAAARVQAAQAMDLIAAIGLGRNDANSLPEETALCLRRAALTGQPSNASLASRLGMQLADMGLDAEAQWTLRHAMQLAPTETGNAETQQRIPTVIELSPQQFASISPAFNTGNVARSSDLPAARSVSHLAPPAQASVQTSAQASSQASVMPESAPPKKQSRFLPVSLAGFRMPFWGSKSPSVPSDVVPMPDPDEMESALADVDCADEFQDDADSAADASAGKPSTMKPWWGKLPKLW